RIVVATYGGSSGHGGGAFSGKDPSKVDRSAAYAMRWVAKNVVAAGLASKCEVQVAYAIGKAEPVGLFVETFGTEVAPVEQIQAALTEVFDLRPAAIIRDLQLLRPIYAQTAAYGHFGRGLRAFPWEAAARADHLKPRVPGCRARGAWVSPSAPPRGSGFVTSGVGLAWEALRACPCRQRPKARPIAVGRVFACVPQW